MIFLIDYENTNLTGLNGIENLNYDDQVIIFHTNANDKMPFELLAKIKCRLEFVLIRPGRQSLDMCLASRLGYLIGCKQGISAQLDCTCDDSNIEDIEPDDIIVVSKDTDYLSMVEMWNEQYHQCIGIRPMISGNNTKPDDKTMGLLDYSSCASDPNDDLSTCILPERNYMFDSQFAHSPAYPDDSESCHITAYNQTTDNQQGKNKKKKKEEEKINRIEQILKTRGMNRNERQEVFRCINRDPKTQNYKSDLYDVMCKILGHKNGRKAYQQIKQLL